MYTVKDFRSNIRKALNEADNGHEVLIERYGQTYQLISLVGEPNKDGTYFAGKHDPEGADEKGLVDQATAIFEGKTCKNGHPSSDGKRCSKMKCVYS